MTVPQLQWGALERFWRCHFYRTFRVYSAKWELGIRLPSGAASYPRKTESLNTPPWKKLKFRKVWTVTRYLGMCVCVNTFYPHIIVITSIKVVLYCWKDLRNACEVGEMHNFIQWMDISLLKMYCLNFRKDLIRTVTQAIYCTFALLIITFMNKQYIIPTLDWLRQETHLQSQYMDISNNAEKQRSVYGNACTPKRSTSFNFYFPWNNPVSIDMSASRTQTRTRYPMLTTNAIPLGDVIRTKRWPPTGEQPVLQWQYLRHITTNSCTVVGGT